MHKRVRLIFTNGNGRVAPDDYSKTYDMPRHYFVKTSIIDASEGGSWCTHSAKTNFPWRELGYSEQQEQ